MDLLNEVRNILADSLQIDKDSLSQDTLLLGAIPEFDSMAVVTVITSLEDNLGILVEDDEISAETFESVQTLVDFIQPRI
jgi:acyl carrier protein